MKKSFKQKLTDYLNSLSDELRLKIDYRKNEPFTPKLNKLGKFAIILCCIIYLLIGFFGGIKSSAAAGGNVKIYSNDGSTLLFTSTGYYSNTDTMTVTSTGVTFSNDSYIYSGAGEFLGLSSTVNSSVADKAVGFTGPIGNFVYYIVEEEGVVPSNLTGYTVTVPAGWTATAGYGMFTIYGTLNQYTLNDSVVNNLKIGYDGTSVSSNKVQYFNSDFVTGYFQPSQSLTFVISGGDSVSSSSLIQWLADNNATFVNNNAPEEPTTVTVPSGMYFLQNAYNDLRGSINFSVPFLSRSSYFDSIEFVGIQNEQYLSIHYVDSHDNISTVFRGDDGWTYNEYSVIYVQSAVELTESEYELFSDSFVSFLDNPDLNTLFSAGQENGQSVGYTNGFTAGKAEGRTEGYNQGFTEGESRGYLDGFDAGYAEGEAQAMEHGFMSEFFGGIVEALDALKLFGQFSVLDIIEGVLGLMLALWILKLIAGG